jgi:hypothetical protein
MEEKRGTPRHPSNNRRGVVPYTSTRRPSQAAREEVPSRRPHPNNKRRTAFKEAAPKQQEKNKEAFKTKLR